MLLKSVVNRNTLHTLPCFETNQANFRNEKQTKTLRAFMNALLLPF